MPFSSADRKSLLPNVFLVTACKKEKKKRGGGENCKKQWENYSQGCVMSRGCGLHAGWECWRRKVGCWEQYQRKSEVFPPVPTVSLRHSWAKFFMHLHFIHWELCTHLGSESQAAQPLRTMGTSVWLRGNTALHYKLMPFPWSQTNRCRAPGGNMQATIHVLNVWHAALQTHTKLPKLQLQIHHCFWIHVHVYRIYKQKSFAWIYTVTVF